MVYKKKIIFFSYTFILILTVIGVFNFSIDSYNQFHTGKKTYYLDLTGYKTNFILKNLKNKKLNLIIGSSRTAAINPDRLKKNADEINYNYSIAGGTPYEQYLNLKFLLEKKIDIKKIYYGLDYYSFTHSYLNLFPFPIYLEASEDKKKYKKFLLYLYSLKVTQNNLKTILKLYNKVPFDFQIKENGQLLYLSREKRIKKKKDYKNFFNNLVPNKTDFGKEKIIKKNIDYFLKIKKLCKKKNIEIVYFFNPTSFKTINLHNKITKKQILDFLVNQQSLKIFNFSFLNEFTLDPMNFYDTSHFTKEFGDKVVDVINNISDQPYVQYLNKDNFNDYQK